MDFIIPAGDRRGSEMNSVDLLKFADEFPGDLDTAILLAADLTDEQVQAAYQVAQRFVSAVLCEQEHRTEYGKPSSQSWSCP
jgi:hypothetical protein